MKTSGEIWLFGLVKDRSFGKSNPRAVKSSSDLLDGWRFLGRMAAVMPTPVSPSAFTANSVKSDNEMHPKLSALGVIMSSSALCQIYPPGKQEIAQWVSAVFCVSFCTL